MLDYNDIDSLNKHLKNLENNYTIQNFENLLNMIKYNNINMNLNLKLFFTCCSISKNLNVKHVIKKYLNKEYISEQKLQYITKLLDENINNQFYINKTIKYMLLYL